MNLIHAEINKKVTKKTLFFYKEIFLWDIEKLSEYDHYYKVRYPDNTVGSFTASLIKREDIGQAIVLTVDIKKMDETFLKKLTNLGGELIGNKISVNDYGTFQYIKDPSGTIFCLKESEHE